MSLLDEAFTECQFINPTQESDGMGGWETVWTDGAKFEAAITFQNSVEAMIAAKQGVTTLYTVTTRKSLKLGYNTVFRRLSDGKIFRVKSDGNDRNTPQSAGLDMRQVQAEIFVLPN